MGQALSGRVGLPCPGLTSVVVLPTGSEKVLITIDGSVLAARLDLATLRRAVQSAGDLLQVVLGSSFCFAIQSKSAMQILFAPLSAQMLHDLDSYGIESVLLCLLEMIAAPLDALLAVRPIKALFA